MPTLRLLLTFSLTFGVTSCRWYSDSAVKTAESSDGLTLDDFDYETDSALFQEVAARVGCGTAKRWVLNSSFSLRKSIDDLKAAKIPYQFLETHFFNNDLPCTSEFSKSDLDGIRKLYDMVRVKGYGLTVAVVGGFGSHLTQEGALSSVQKYWSETLPGGLFRATRVECTPNSYAPDAICSQVIRKKIEKMIDQEGAQKHLYLIWGYSKGGSSALEAIAQSQKIRDRLVSLVSLSSPFGGGVPMKIMVPLTGYIEPHLQNLPKKDQLAFASLLLQGSGVVSQEAGQSIEKIVELFSAENIPLIKEGMVSLLPGNRKAYLQEQVKTWNLRRSVPHPLTGRFDTSIFHVSAIADIRRFKVIPHLALTSDRALTVDLKTFEPLQAAEMALISELAKHPLSDLSVALEHSVLPKTTLPQNARTALTGILLLDHPNSGLGSGAELIGIPTRAIADSIVDLISQKMREQP